MQRILSTRFALAFSFLTSVALGCVITVGPGGDDAGVHDCGSLLAHNDANCVCDDGYERCNPGDPDDTDCCIKEGKGDGMCPDQNSFLDGDQCFCNDGYAWCNPDDLDDLSCCEDPGQTSQGTGTMGGTMGTGTTEDLPTTSQGTSGGPMECPNPGTPPQSCDPETEPFFCTHPESCGPEGSQFYQCMGGVYVEVPGGPNENCTFEGYDFGYGCVDTGSSVEFVCGYGPGTACQTGSASSCQGEANLESCVYGKATVTDCFAECTMVGDGMGVLYDYGYCGEQDGEIQCLCCDEGDEGCPAGGGTSSGTGGSSSGGTSG